MKKVLDTSGSAAFVFDYSDIEESGICEYFFVVNHRNSIETWSKLSNTLVNQNRINYNFSSDSSQAYGDNMVRKGTKYCIYSGDVNQNGTVDGSDMFLVENDISNNVTGYVSTDLNGDEIVDGSDYSIVDNNAYNNVSLIKP